MRREQSFRLCGREEGMEFVIELSAEREDSRWSGGAAPIFSQRNSMMIR
jgi:hypothetical protein